MLIKYIKKKIIYIITRWRKLKQFNKTTKFNIRKIGNPKQKIIKQQTLYIKSFLIYIIKQ